MSPENAHFAVSILKALIEVALYALLAKGLLGLLAGAKREQNFFYQLLTIITNPVTKTVRRLAPKFVADQHIGALSFFLLVVIWFATILGKTAICANEYGKTQVVPQYCEAKR